MGVVRKIKNNELVGGTTTEDVYPITSNKAVFDSDNTSLEVLLYRNMPINITSSYTTGIIRPISLRQAITSVPSDKRKTGFIGIYLDSNSGNWEIIKYNGSNTSIENWTSPDNWSKLLSKDDIVDSEGSSTTKVMSQKAVTDFVKAQEARKIVYNLTVFDGLSVGNNVTSAFTPIAGYDGEGMLFPSAGDLLQSVSTDTADGLIVYSRESSLRDNTQVVIYINLKGLNFIYIQNNKVTEVKRNVDSDIKTYNLDKFRTLQVGMDATDAFTPRDSDNYFVPSKGDLLQSSIGEFTEITFMGARYNAQIPSLTLSYIDGMRLTTIVVNKNTFIVEAIYISTAIYSFDKINALTNESTVDEAMEAFTPIAVSIADSFNRWPQAGDVLIGSKSTSLVDYTQVNTSRNTKSIVYSVSSSRYEIIIQGRPAAVRVYEYPAVNLDDFYIDLNLESFLTLTNSSSQGDIAKCWGLASTVTSYDIQNAFVKVSNKEVINLVVESTSTQFRNIVHGDFYEIVEGSGDNEVVTYRLVFTYMNKVYNYDFKLNESSEYTVTITAIPILNVTEFDLESFVDLKTASDTTEIRNALRIEATQSINDTLRRASKGVTFLTKTETDGTIDRVAVDIYKTSGRADLLSKTGHLVQFNYGGIIMQRFFYTSGSLPSGPSMEIEYNAVRGYNFPLGEPVEV